MGLSGIGFQLEAFHMSPGWISLNAYSEEALDFCGHRCMKVQRQSRDCFAKQVPCRGRGGKKWVAMPFAPSSVLVPSSKARSP